MDATIEARSTTAGVIPATVTEAAEKQWCRLRRDDEAEGAGEAEAAGHWARIALADGGALRAGDRVLAVWPDAGPRYVIGVLERAPGVSPREERIRAADGASASRCERDGEEVIEVRDAESRVLFEYRPGSGRAVVHQPAGDLRIAAPGGGIELYAGRDVQLLGAEGLSLRSAGAIELASAGQAGRPAGLSLGDSGAELRGHTVRVAAGRAEVRADRLDVAGDSADVRVERASVFARVLDTVSERVRQRAERVQQHVEDLLDVCARRTRTVVDETQVTRAGRIHMTARGRVRVDGEKIHLG